MKNLIVSILISVSITLGGLWYYDRHYATKIAVIDMTSYVNHLKTDYLAHKLSEKDLDAGIRRLSRRIKNQNHSRNTVILLKEVVVSGKVEDFSPKPEDK